MIVKIGKINIGIVCILWFFSSCIDETFTNTGDVEGTYISVRGIGLQKSTDYGSSEDYIIRNFRILASTRRPVNANPTRNTAHGRVTSYVIRLMWAITISCSLPMNLPISLL